MLFHLMWLNPWSLPPAEVAGDIGDLSSSLHVATASAQRQYDSKLKNFGGGCLLVSSGVLFAG